MDLKAIYDDFLNKEKEVFNILKELYKYSGHMGNLNEKINYIENSVKTKVKKDELGNLSITIGNNPFKILIPIGIDDGILDLANKKYNIFSKNLYGTGIKDNLKIATILLIIDIFLKHLHNELEITFLFFVGQHSNYEGLTYYLENNNQFSMAISIEGNAINKLGINPINYFLIRVYRNEENISPYFKLGEFLGRLRKYNKVDNKIIIKRIMNLSHNDKEPKLGFVDLLFRTRLALKEILKIIEKTAKNDFFYNVIHKYEYSKKMNEEPYIKRFFNDSILYLKQKNDITLLPISSSISMLSALVRKYNIFSFDLGLFTFVYSGIDREEIILPTLNLGLHNFLNILVDLIAIGDNLYEVR